LIWWKALDNFYVEKLIAILTGLTKHAVQMRNEVRFRAGSDFEITCGLEDLGLVLPVSQIR
jgi:hypothetical protein